MIRMKSLLWEMTDSDIQRCLQKIRDRQLTFIAAGDNGKVYQIDGEDKIFKTTGSPEEFEIAEILANRESEFSAFIPVYWTDGNNSYIMANAEELSAHLRKELDLFNQDFAHFSRDEGGEVSVFDFMQDAGELDDRIAEFLTRLESDVKRLGVSELELDLDFRADNIMMYNGHMVMVDW